MSGETFTFPLPVAPGPPRMFQITSVTTTSLSFSWQEPAVLNGMLTGYNLSCQPVLPANIPSPPILSPGPTVNTALLPALFPGMRYNCSIMARNSAGSSDPVHAVGTTTETGTSKGHMVMHYYVSNKPHNFFHSQPQLVHHKVSQSLHVEQETWHFPGPFLPLLNTMEWSLATPSPVSLRLVVGGPPLPCSTQQQAPSHWEGSHHLPPTTAPSQPKTVREVVQCQVWSALLQKLVSNCFQAEFVHLVCSSVFRC